MKKILILTVCMFTYSNLNATTVNELTEKCNNGSAKSCASLGKIYAFGKGTIANKAKAKKYLKLACQQKDEDACSNFNALNDEDKTSYKNFKLKTVKGKTINIFETYGDGLKVHEFEGKNVFIFFFGNLMYSKLDGQGDPISSTFLKETNLYTNLILFETKETKDLKIIGIEAQAYPASKLKKFVNDYNMKKNIIAGVDYPSFIQYITDMLGRKNISIPFLLAINKQGEVKYIHGYTTGGNIETASRVLEKKDVDYLLENLNK